MPNYSHKIGEAPAVANRVGYFGEQPQSTDKDGVPYLVLYIILYVRESNESKIKKVWGLLWDPLSLSLFSKNIIYILLLDTAQAYAFATKSNKV